MAVLPGLPFMPFAILSVTCVLLGRSASRKEDQIEEEEKKKDITPALEDKLYWYGPCSSWSDK